MLLRFSGMDKSRTTTTLAALTVAALAFGLVSCDNENDVTPSTPTTEAVEPAAPTDGVVTADNPAGTDETAYTASLDQFGVNTGTDELGVNLGQATCEAWDLGESFTATMLAIAPLDGSGFTARESGYIMAAAAMFLCPEHLPAAQAWSEQNA